MIICPICGSKTRVLETRVLETCATRRRRGCRIAGCSGKVTTVEVVVPDGQAITFINRFREFMAAQIQGAAQ